MYVIGFCDSVLDMLLEYSTDFDGIVGTAKDRANVKRYQEIRARNMHKMLPIPVCKF